MNKAEYKKAYYLRNKEKLKERSRIWYLENRDRALKSVKEYRVENKEKIAAYNKKRSLKIKEQRRVYMREYYKKNGVALKARAREWAKSEKGLLLRRLANQRRRLSINTTDDGTITPSMILTFLIGQKYRCVLCEELFLTEIGEDKRNWQIDHIKPLAKGGAHSMKNMQLLCKPCNGRKSDYYAETPPSPELGRA